MRPLRILNPWRVDTGGAGLGRALVGLALVLAGLVWALPGAAAARSGRARTDAELPAPFRRSPYALMSLSVGLPNAGWQLRAKQLKRSPSLWIQDKSVPYSYGHPALVLMLNRTAKQIARQSPGSVLLVGDLSREYGGPLAGHRSHQSGRDADVGFFVTDAKGRAVNSQSLRTFDREGRARDKSGLRFDDYRNWLLVQLWLKDSRAALEHVFVASHLRQRLLDFARARPAFAQYVADAAAFLRQPSTGLPHDDHFHIRIACPERQRDLCGPPPAERRASAGASPSTGGAVGAGGGGAQAK
ncbi:MAG TPA: penicillin-insensitive murein endopeptidase [Polyangiaceae bacterium]|nr:penicillin-insensitive murein endopeptidase [Polyangiaceae bacterium]